MNATGSIDSDERFPAKVLLESTPVRGEIVHLDATWRAVLERRRYPAPLQSLLGDIDGGGRSALGHTQVRRAR